MKLQVGGDFARAGRYVLWKIFLNPTKSLKSRYKYRIISSVIWVKILNIITTDICIDFQLNARIFTLYSIGI